MKVNLPIEEGYFNISHTKFCDVDSYLITPEIDAKWNSKNLHFRSLVVDKDGNVLSCGFPKFFNYGEKTDCYPNPKKYTDWRILNKLDGSLLIADFVNEIFSMRTRGTSTYKNQENYKDFEVLPFKYPKITEYLKYNQKYSLLFEILTPNNVIVIRPKEIQFYFLGAVNKETMEMVSNEELLTIWKQIGCVPVPEHFEFNSIIDIESLSEIVKIWRGREGVVLVYNNGQNRLKLKSDWYCFLHRVKSQLNSRKNLIELYVNKGLPNYEDFFSHIEAQFDFEIAFQLKDQIEEICVAGEKAKKFIDNALSTVYDLRTLNSRKEQAEMIKKNYQSKSSYVFLFLDGKKMSSKDWIKIVSDYL
jgi:hypothetical protein